MNRTKYKCPVSKMIQANAVSYVLSEIAEYKDCISCDGKRVFCKGHQKYYDRAVEYGWIEEE